jgi:transposase
MAKPKRQAVEPPANWQQLELLCTSPEQRAYELIRPVVLFGVPPRERAHQTGTAERTLYRTVQRFAEHGMASLFTTPRKVPRLRLPDAIRAIIVALKAEHPPLHLREIATICYVRFGRRLSHHTVRRVLAEHPQPTVPRRYPPFHAIPDPVARRSAIIRLHAEGWHTKSIADYLQTSRKTVRLTLKRWIEEGFRGLPNKSSAPKHPRRKVNFSVLTAVRRLARNPRVGAWRVHAALRQEGIRLSPRTCGRMLALNRDLYNLPRTERQPRAKKSMPFQATYRHQYWTVDIRYLDHQLGGGNIYAISIMENYSRAILASAISRKQDVTAFLIVLFTAIQQHGSPNGLVSDSGSVFRAKKALEIYSRLSIAKHAIDKRQPWQSYIETTFAVQQRMADYHFAQATSWQELQAAHDRWVGDYNFQVHWAHRLRDDGRESPAEVLDWVYGHVWEPDVLHYAFNALRFRRRLDRMGYVRFRAWRLYSEPGLAQRLVAVWLYKEQLVVAYNDTHLAQYTVAYEPDQKHLYTVINPQLYETQYCSPQLPLWQFGDTEWLKVLRLPRVVIHRKTPQISVIQERLFV